MIHNYPDSSGNDASSNLVEDLFSRVIGSTKETLDYQPSLARVEEGNTSIRVIPPKVLIEGPSSYEEVDILVLSEIVQSLFRIAENEEFEDGSESYFSTGLQNLIESYGNLALSIVAQYLFRERTSVKVVSETLRQLGKINDVNTHKNRLRILEKCLLSKSPYIRDSAGLGISFLDDPAAIQKLEEAIERELNPELKKDLGLVLEQLENSQQ